MTKTQLNKMTTTELQNIINRATGTRTVYSSASKKELIAEIGGLMRKGLVK